LIDSDFVLVAYAWIMKVWAQRLAMAAIHHPSPQGLMSNHGALLHRQNGLKMGDNLVASYPQQSRHILDNI
jgi:hypothetical protein